MRPDTMVAVDEAMEVVDVTGAEEEEASINAYWRPPPAPDRIIPGVFGTAVA